MRNEDDRSSTALGTSVCDLLEKLLGVFSDGHLVSAALVKLISAVLPFIDIAVDMSL